MNFNLHSSSTPENTIRADEKIDDFPSQATEYGSSHSLRSGESLNSLIEECPICFDKIGGINNCRTQCGHAFCFKCIAEAMNKDTRCPFCRQELVESKSNDTIKTSESGDESDDGWDTYDEDDSDDEDSDDEDSSNLGNIETIVERFTKQGYTILDAMMILTERSSKTNQTYNEEYLSQITDKFEEIMEELDNETYECNLMKQEDVQPVVNA